MPRRLTSRVAPTDFEDPDNGDDTRIDSSAALSCMEVGSEKNVKHQQQHLHKRYSPKEDLARKITVAATEARINEYQNSRTRALRYLCLTKAVFVVLLVLVVGFASLSAYAWMKAFTQGKFDNSLGMITFLFMGTVLCALFCRRRIIAATADLYGSSSQAAGRWIPHQQGVPWHIRQSYDYFIFGEETDSVKSDAETGTASSDATTSSRDHSRNSSDNPCADGTDDVGFGAIPSDTVNDITMLRREVVIIEENMSPPQHEADGYRRSDRRIGDHHDERQKQQSQQQQQRYTELGWVSSPPIVCTICDEGFALGDRMCRLPCAHAFHVECSDAWLDEHHICPHCGLDLLAVDTTFRHRSRCSVSNGNGAVVRVPPMSPPRYAESPSGLSNRPTQPGTGTPPPHEHFTYCCSSDIGSGTAVPDSASWPPFEQRGVHARNVPSAAADASLGSPAKRYDSARPENALISSPPMPPFARAMTPGLHANTVTPATYGTTPPRPPRASVTSRRSNYDSPNHTPSLSRASMTPPRLLQSFRRASKPRARRTPKSGANITTTVHSPCSSEAGSFTAITEYNTAVNATMNRPRSKVGVEEEAPKPAPYAYYFDSPQTNSPASTRAAFETVDSPDLLAETSWYTSTKRSELATSAALPQTTEIAPSNDCAEVQESAGLSRGSTLPLADQRSLPAAVTEARYTYYPDSAAASPATTVSRTLSLAHSPERPGKAVAITVTSAGQERADGNISPPAQQIVAVNEATDALGSPASAAPASPPAHDLNDLDSSNPGLRETALISHQRSPPRMVAAPNGCYLDSPGLAASPLAAANLAKFRMSPDFVKVKATAAGPSHGGSPSLSTVEDERSEAASVIPRPSGPFISGPVRHGVAGRSAGGGGGRERDDRSFPRKNRVGSIIKQWEERDTDRKDVDYESATETDGDLQMEAARASDPAEAVVVHDDDEEALSPPPLRRLVPSQSPALMPSQNGRRTALDAAGSARAIFTVTDGDGNDGGTAADRAPELVDKVSDVPPVSSLASGSTLSEAENGGSGSWVWPIVAASWWSILWPTADDGVHTKVNGGKEHGQEMKQREDKQRREEEEEEHRAKGRHPYCSPQSLQEEEEEEHRAKGRHPYCSPQSLQVDHAFRQKNAHGLGEMSLAGTE